jgi:AbrB family looped-hinge helix DNA binding protein
LWENLSKWDDYLFVGYAVSSTIVKVDQKGRIIIPRDIRETSNLKEGSCLTMRTEGKTIIIEPIEPVADKYYGAFKITKWPENMDEFIVEVIKKWWTTQPT